MASQMNPIIAAFLQSRAQAEETVRGMQQQQLMQQRLQIEQEAQEAENEYQRLNLERLISESQQKAKEFTVTSKQNELRNKFQALGTVSNVLDKNLMSVSGVSKLIKESGLPEEVANELISAAERQAQEREAKIAEAKALMPVKVEEAGKVAGAQAEARLPSQLKITEKQGTIREQLQQRQNEAAYKRAIDVANLRIANSNNISKKREIYENMPASPQELEFFKDPATGQIPAFGTTRRELYGMQTNKPLTQAQTQELVDLQTAEALFKEIADEFNAGGDKYFVGPLGAAWRSGVTKNVTGLGEAEARMEAKLGRTLATIGHPLFGASFTKGEKEILTSFVPDPKGNLNPQGAKAKIEQALKFINMQRMITHGVKSSKPVSAGPKDGETFTSGGKTFKMVGGVAVEQKKKE